MDENSKINGYVTFVSLFFSSFIFFCSSALFFFVCVSVENVDQMEQGNVDVWQVEIETSKWTTNKIYTKHFPKFMVKIYHVLHFQSQYRQKFILKAFRLFFSSSVILFPFLRCSHSGLCLFHSQRMCYDVRWKTFTLSFCQCDCCYCCISSDSIFWTTKFIEYQIGFGLVIVFDTGATSTNTIALGPKFYGKFEKLFI